MLDGAPTGYCLHRSCGASIDLFNKELRREIWFEENGKTGAPTGHWAAGVAPQPKQDLKSRPEIDRYAIWELTRGVPPIDGDWLRRRSPMDVESVESAELLWHLYREDERVLVFTDQKTQGDFIGWKRAVQLTDPEGSAQVETFRLSPQRNVSAVRSKLPTGGKERVWFLVQPVTGKWEIRADAHWDAETKSREVQGKWSRRSHGNVTSWRFFVLESDELEAEEWLKVLVSLPFPIAAIWPKAVIGCDLLHRMYSRNAGSKMRIILSGSGGVGMVWQTPVD